MTGDFIIIYEFNRMPRRVETPLESQWNFEELRQGFWIDRQHSLVPESRGKYWIPPGMIRSIEKKD